MTQIEARDVVVREEVFQPRLQEAARDCGQWAAATRADRGLLGTPASVAKLRDVAHRLESFLDDHGARENRTFVTFGELVASIRGLAAVKCTGLHLVGRLPRYDSVGQQADLAVQLGEGFARVDEGLHALCGGLLDEARKLGIEPWGPVGGLASDEIQQRKLLPRNLDADVSVDEREHIAQIAAKFQAVLEASRGLGLGSIRGQEELARFVVDHASEERCRWYESAVHNIQSMYDTYVLRTAAEQENPWLKYLRGHASIALHLLEMATGLVHFYERHENVIRHKGVRETIARLVSKGDILSVAVNVCLRHAYLAVEGCAEIIERALRTFIVARRVRLALPDGVTLHARPLALIVQVVRHHGTPVELTIEGQNCSASSLMSLIMLGAAHPKPKFVEARGDSRALQDLERLFEIGLGEAGGRMPPELGYLRIAR